MRTRFPSLKLPALVFSSRMLVFLAFVFASCGGLLRAQLQSMLLPDATPKNATLPSLKSKVVAKWLRGAKSLDLLKECMEHPTTAESSSISQAASASSAPVCAAAAAQALSTTGQAVAGKAKDAGKAKKAQSVLEQCPVISGEHADETSNFTSVGQGPPLPDAEKGDVPISEIVLQGTDGIIPVAALVKILQGFQELSDGIAVLYAEMCSLLKPKVERKIVRRVLMGTADQVREVYESEKTACLPKLRVWGVLFNANSSESTSELAGELGLQDVLLGTVDPTNIPTDLSRPHKWCLSSFLRWNDNSEAGLSCPTYTTCMCLMPVKPPHRVLSSDLFRFAFVNLAQVRIMLRGKNAILRDGFRFIPDIEMPGWI